MQALPPATAADAQGRAGERAAQQRRRGRSAPIPPRDDSAHLPLPAAKQRRTDFSYKRPVAADAAPAAQHQYSHLRPLPKAAGAAQRASRAPFPAERPPLPAAAAAEAADPAHRHRSLSSALRLRRREKRDAAATAAVTAAVAAAVGELRAAAAASAQLAQRCAAACTGRCADALSRTVNVLTSFGYNPEGPRFNVDKNRPLSAIFGTADEILAESPRQPIQCVEAVFVALRLTQGCTDMLRVPISFQSRKWMSGQGPFPTNTSDMDCPLRRRRAAAPNAGSGGGAGDWINSVVVVASDDDPAVNGNYYPLPDRPRVWASGPNRLYHSDNFWRVSTSPAFMTVGACVLRRRSEDTVPPWPRPDGGSQWERGHQGRWLPAAQTAVRRHDGAPQFSDIKHIVLGVRCGGKWGTLGLSRHPGLMTKPTEFATLADLCWDFSQQYRRDRQELVCIRFGAPVSHAPTSSPMTDLVDRGGVPHWRCSRIDTSKGWAKAERDIRGFAASLPQEPPALP